MSLVILLLLTDEKKAYLRIVYYILYLLLTAGSIERDGNDPNAIRTEIRIQILQAVLRKHTDFFLWFNPEVNQGVRHLFHARRKLLPRNGFPLQTAKAAEGQRITRTILLRLFMNQHGEVTSCLHEIENFILYNYKGTINRVTFQEMALLIFLTC